MARFLWISVLLTVASIGWGHVLAEALIPIFRTEIEILDDTFQVRSLALDHAKAELALRLEVARIHPVVLGGVVYAPDPRGRAWVSAPAAHVTLVAIVLCATAFARRAVTWSAVAARGAAMCGAVALLWALDVPACLVGAVWDLSIATASPGEFSLWVAWLRFMENGGRFALALALGGVCALIGKQESGEPAMGGSAVR